MSFHRTGPANDPGSVILMFVVSVMPIVFWLVVVFALFAFGSMIWSGVQAKQRRRKAGQSPEQFLRAAEQSGAEQVGKAEEEWSLPPELKLPTPRLVRSAPSGHPPIAELPRLIFLMALAILIYYTGGYLWTHVRWRRKFLPLSFMASMVYCKLPGGKGGCFGRAWSLRSSPG